MNEANIAMLEVAAVAIAPILDQVAFVGGTTIELWVTDEAAPEFRPTKDVDVIVEITTRAAYYRLEERLRDLGFENHEEDGVICRFRQPGLDLLLDAMPVEASILGFEVRWLRESFPRAVLHELPSGRTIKLIRLLDGRRELIGELGEADGEVRSFIAARGRAGDPRSLRRGAATEGRCGDRARRPARRGTCR